MEGATTQQSLAFALLLQLLLTGATQVCTQAYMLKVLDNDTVFANVSISGVPSRGFAREQIPSTPTKGIAVQLCPMRPSREKCSMIELIAKGNDGKFLWQSFRNVPLDLWGHYEREFYDQGYPDSAWSLSGYSNFNHDDIAELEMRRKDGIFSVSPRGHPEWAATVPEPWYDVPYPRPRAEFGLLVKERFDYEPLYTTFRKLDVKREEGSQ